jgi:putative salt-induced outer membrane protein YdiY
MQIRRAIASFVVFLLVSLISPAAFAQAAPDPDTPSLWDWQLGGSFVGTSGNADTSTVGLDFAFHGRWPRWKILSTATAVRTTDSGKRTADRYLASFRAERKLASLVSMTSGERVERDHLSGIDFRSVFDTGLSWALIRSDTWTLDGVTSAAWTHEERRFRGHSDHPVGVVQALSRVSFDRRGDTTQRFTYYPDFRRAAEYRAEAEVAAQAAINSRLALRLGYLWRYSNSPVPGFGKVDNTTTASVVLRFHADESAPPAD